jgi:hypothetical protein
MFEIFLILRGCMGRKNARKGVNQKKLYIFTVADGLLSPGQ